VIIGVQADEIDTVLWASYRMHVSHASRNFSLADGADTSGVTFANQLFLWFYFPILLRFLFGYYLFCFSKIRPCFH